MPDKKRYAAIDALRIVAAAAVVFFHSGNLIPSHALRVMGSYGYLGVELFFMISGFVIALSAMERTRSQFAYARFVRLWPTFIICMVLLIVARGWPGTAVALANTTMLPRLFGQPYLDIVYWTLMYEILFYAGIAVFLTADDKFLTRLRMVTAVWLIASVIGQFIPIGKIKILLVLDYAPFFSVGISIFLLERTGRSIANFGLLGISVFLSAIFSAVQCLQGNHSGGAVVPTAWVCSLVVLASAAALYAATQMDLGKRGDKIAFALGGISYPLYLLHFGFGSALAARLGEATGLIAMVVTCYLVWRIELPIRNWLMGRSGMFPRFART